MIKIIDRAADRLSAWVAPKAVAEATCYGAGTTYTNYICSGGYQYHASCYVAGNCVGICGTYTKTSPAKKC